MILSRLRPQCRPARPCSLERAVRRDTRTIACTGANANAISIYRRSYCFCCRFFAAALFAPAAKAEDAPKDVKGLYLMSDYPAVTLRPGETSRSVSSCRITTCRRSAGAVGNGRAAAGRRRSWAAASRSPRRCRRPNPASRCSCGSTCRRMPTIGTQTLTVTAKGGSTQGTLPIAVTLAKDLPAKLTLTPQLPELRGTSKSSFEYQLAIKNDSGKKLTVSLAAQAPQNFDTSFTEPMARRSLTRCRSTPARPRTSSSRCRPPNTVARRRLPVTARVAAEDASATDRSALDITGQPQARRQRPRGAGIARARRPASRPRSRSSSPIPAPRRPTTSSCRGSAPSGWKVTFDPKTIDRIAPNDNKEVQALMTPTDKAIAGDYVTTIRAVGARRDRFDQFPRHGDDLDDVGHRRRRHHRRRAAGDGGRGGEVRPPMSRSPEPTPSSRPTA